MSFLFKKLTASAVVISMLSSCAVVVPTLNETNTFERCGVFTKKIELDIVSQKISPLHCHDEMCAAFLVVSASVFATSAIISSSIYLVGNTDHYLEKEARCNDRSIIDKKVVEFSEQMEEIGAEKVDEGKIKIIEEDTSLNGEPTLKVSDFKYIELDDIGQEGNTAQ